MSYIERTTTDELAAFEALREGRDPGWEPL